MGFPLLSTSVDNMKNKESIPDQQSDITCNKINYTSPSRLSTSSKITKTVFETYVPNLSLSPSSPKSLLSHPLSSPSLCENKNETKTRLKVTYQEHPAKNQGLCLAKEYSINPIDSKEFDIQKIFPDDTLKNTEAPNFDKSKIDNMNMTDSSNTDLLEFLSDDSENSNDSDVNNLGFQAVELSSEPDFEAASIQASDNGLGSDKAHETESIDENKLDGSNSQEQETELNISFSENIVPEVIEQLEKIGSENKQRQIVKVLQTENKQMIRNIKSYNWYDRARGKSSIFPSSNLKDYKNSIQFEKTTNPRKRIGHNTVRVEHSQELVKYNNIEIQKKKPLSEFEFDSQTETETDTETESEMIKPKRCRHLKRKHIIEDDSYADLLIEKFANNPKSQKLKQIGEPKAMSNLKELDVHKPKKKVTLTKLMKDGRRKRYDYKVHVNPDTLPSFITQFMKPPNV